MRSCVSRAVQCWLCHDTGLAGAPLALPALHHWSVSQTDSTKGQAGTLHSQVHSCRHQGRSTWLRALWLKIRKHSVSHTRLLRRKGEPITEFQNTASAPQCDTEITVPTMVNVSGKAVSFQCKDILSMPSEAEVCCSSVYLQAVISKAEF